MEKEQTTTQDFRKRIFKLKKRNQKNNCVTEDDKPVPFESFDASQSSDLVNLRLMVDKQKVL